jgi:CPA2 family monovalent cation:H+ antiporter-2
METPGFLAEVAALVIATAVVAYVLARLRIVSILGFLLVGVVIGPNALGLVNDLDVVEAVAEIGVILLLFTIGIEFRLERLIRIRRLVLGAGALQVGLAVALTGGMLAALGVPLNAAVFTGMLVALSSTAVVLRVLADRGETGSRMGQASLALLIFQDLAVVFMVVAVPILAGQTTSLPDTLWTIARAIGVVVVILVLARRVMPRMLDVVARTCSQEVFLLVVMAVAIGTAYFSSLAGVSVSLGAFLAGLLVSESRYNVQALGEIVPLQIIFSAAFFASVGMLLDIGFVLDSLGVVLLAIGGVLLVKFLSGFVALRITGLGAGLAGGAALGLAQLGEFSFVLERAGASAGLAPAGMEGSGSQTFIAAAVVLMLATPALLSAGSRLSHARRVAEEVPPSALPAMSREHVAGHVVIAGYGSAAETLAGVLDRTGIRYVITTRNPDAAAQSGSEERRVIMGDAGRRQTLHEADLEHAQLVVVGDDDETETLRIIHAAHAMRPDIPILVRVHEGEAAVFRSAGANEVITSQEASALSLAVHVLRRFGVANRSIAGEIERISSGSWVPGLLAERLQLSDEAQQVTFAPDPTEACEHVSGLGPVTPSAPGCEDCLRIGARWVHLRICMSCGHVGCCDSSANRHATAHFHETGHPVMRSLEPREAWGWCYVDQQRINPAQEEPAA